MKKGYLYIAIAAVIYGSAEFFFKLGSYYYHPIQMTLLRTFISGLVLMPLAWADLKRAQTVISSKDWLALVLLGFVSGVLCVILFQMAIVLSSASFVAALYTTNPVLTSVLAMLLLKESLYKNNIWALVICVVGAVVLIRPGQTAFSTTAITVSLLGMLSFSLFSILSKNMIIKYGSIAVSCYTTFAGSLFVLGIILVGRLSSGAAFFTNIGLGIFAHVPIFSGNSLPGMAVMVYLVVINTCVGLICYLKAIEETSAIEASVAMLFKPILSPILAVLFLEEVITTQMIIAIIIILAGSLTGFIPGLKRYRKSQLAAQQAAAEQQHQPVGEPQLLSTAAAE